MRPAAAAALFVLSGCATTGVWERWEAGERARYFGLSWVAPDSVMEAYRSLPERASRDSCYRRYWERLDPSGQAEAEHRRRLGQSQELFGGEVFYRDERSAAWVGHGQPEVRLCYDAQPHAVDMRHSKILIEQPWEIWEYQSLGRQFDFIRKGDYYRMVWSGVSDRLHPIAYFQIDSAKTVSDPGTEGWRQDSLGLRYTRFRSSKADLMRWELYWWLPLDRLKSDRYALIVAIDGPEGAAVAETLSCRLMRPEGALPQPFAFGQNSYDLKPGFYRAELRLLDPAGGVCFKASESAELLAYRRGVQESSDVELAVLSDTTYTAPQFRKGDYRRIVAMPGETVGRYQPFFVYYEIYNLSVGRDGRHYLTVDHQIFSTDEQGRTKECLINTDPIESAGQGDTYRGCQKIHLLSENLPPGSYVLRVNAEDQLSGRSSQALQGFVLKPEAKPGKSDKDTSR